MTNNINGAMQAIAPNTTNQEYITIMRLMIDVKKAPPAQLSTNLPLQKGLTGTYYLHLRTDPAEYFPEATQGNLRKYQGIVLRLLERRIAKSCPPNLKDMVIPSNITI